MSRRPDEKNVPGRSNFKGYFRILLLTLALVFLRADLSSAASDWPCPDFGPCRAHITFGDCKAFLFFEYSRRPQTRGDFNLWETDEPKDCSLSLRIGQNLEKFTFVHYYCAEILEMFQTALTKNYGTPVSNIQLYRCSEELHRGIFTMVYPDITFKEGAWKSLNRNSVRLAGLESCGLQTDSRVMVCPDLEGEARDWLTDLFVKIRWRVRATPLVKTPLPKKLILPPGDFHRE